MVAKRKEGHVFSLQEHIAGLIYAQLTNQTKWSRIVPQLKEIDALFFHYEPERIKEMPGKYFADGIFKLKCSNISTRAQMRGLVHNIEIMELLCREFGSMDDFVLSNEPYKIVEMFSNAKSPYKLSLMGEALTWEYVRNVGIDGCKPDTHLRRFLVGARMGTASIDVASVEETIIQVQQLALEIGLTMASVDNIIWSFCADGFGEICTATPHCEKCVVRTECIKYLTDHLNVDRARELTISYAELQELCDQCNRNPLEIGQHILKMLEKEPASGTAKNASSTK